MLHLKHKYTIVTPAYNEQRTLGKTIESVSAQSLLPAAWVMVDDGSTDGAGEVIERYAQEHPWIVPVRREKIAQASHFGRNVGAIMNGVERLRDRRYHYLGILDADITLPSHYYETIVGRMQADPWLGIGSGVYEDLVNGRLEPVLSDRRSTPKAVMLFRRQVFARLGGLLSIACGCKETDSCHRFKAAGWKMLFTPDAKIVHFGRCSSRKMKSAMTLQLRASVLLFFRKHRSGLAYSFACILSSIHFFTRSMILILSLIVGCFENSRPALTYLNGSVRSLFGWRSLSFTRTTSGTYL